MMNSPSKVHATLSHILTPWAIRKNEPLLGFCTVLLIGGQWWWEPASSEELLAKGFDFFSP